jgi:tetratricopeptide (TPR) repeat protein
MGKKKRKKTISGEQATAVAAPATNNATAVLLAFTVIALLLYANSLNNPFIWDDHYLITENHFVKSGKYIAELFTHHLYYSTAGASNFYRPLQTLLLSIDYSLWKANPFGYHITNIAFHIFCAFAVYLLIVALFKHRMIATMVGLLFLVHPANSTVVNYISSRADSQATLFVVLSLYLFLRSWAGQRAAFYMAGSLICFVLGLLSKELAIILPFLLLVIKPLVAQPPRLYWKRALPFFAVLIAYGALRLTVLDFSVAGTGTPPALSIRLLTTAESFTRLMGILIVPLQIHIEKRLAYSAGLFEPSTFFSVMLIGALLFSVYAMRRRSAMASFGFAWFFMALLPMANIMPINATIADHWLYLPSCGFFLGIIGMLTYIKRRLSDTAQRTVKSLGLGTFALIIGVFAVLTFRQNTIWKDPLRFYELAIRYNPQSFRAHNEIGVICMNEERDYDRAIREFRQAIAINGQFDQAYDNLGVAYDHKGNLREAVAQHKKAIAINPYNAKTYNNMGNAFNKMGRFDEAIGAYKKALRLNPDYKAAYNNIAVVYYKKRDYQNARHYWTRALRVDPGFKTAIDNLNVLDRLESTPRGAEKRN